MKISDELDPHSLNNVKLKALWSLDKMENDTTDRFSASEVARFLVEDYGINTTRQAVQSALMRDKSTAHKNKSGYKLMEKGRSELKELLQHGSVITIESGKPFTAKNVDLKVIFSSLGDEILIADPYVDVQTIDSVFKNIESKQKVKILTQNIIDKPQGVFGRHLAELRKEGYQIEVGVYSNSDMHDRYIMDEKTFWLSGNSLNHLGSKESFIVRLGADVLQSMTSMFHNRWKVSNKI